MNDELSVTFREFPPLLMDLVSKREVLTEQVFIADATGDPEMYAAAQQDLAECETALRIAVTELVKKADGFAAYILAEQDGANAAKKEADRCYALATLRQGRVDRMKQIGIEVLQSLGKKFIRGETSELRRWGNGGPHPVEVRQPELLPERYQRFELRLSGEELADLMESSELEGSKGLESHELRERAKPIEPDTDLIRRDLMVEGPCSNCNGHGRWTTDDGNGATFECVPCKGTGKVYVGSVPGAVLVERGEHLRIR